MAHGITFHQGSNAMICGVAEFSVRKNGVDMGRYKLGFGDGMWVDKWTGGKWEPLKKGGSAVVIPYLISDVFPQKKDGCQVEWTWRDFIIALDFWCEGRAIGESEGLTRACERMKS